MSDDAASGRGPGRVAALDLGARRIGVAYSDSRRTLASPWGTIQRSGDAARDRSAVVDAVREVEASTVLVGLPLSLSGQVGPAARSALDEAAALRELLEPLGVTVETADERFTTVEAERSLRGGGPDRKGGAQGRRQRGRHGAAAGLVGQRMSGPIDPLTVTALTPTPVRRRRGGR